MAGLDEDLKVATLSVVLSIDLDQSNRVLAEFFPKSAKELGEINPDGLGNWHFSFDLIYLPKDHVTQLWDRKNKDFSVVYPGTYLITNVLAGKDHEILVKNQEASSPKSDSESLQLIMGGKSGWDWEVGLGVRSPDMGVTRSLAKINLWDIFVHLSADVEHPFNAPGFTLSSDEDLDAEQTHLLLGRYFTLRLQLRQAWLG